MTQEIIRQINFWNNKLVDKQEQLDTIYQTINNFKMPYKYFKKFNILPIDIVEGELDKYFDIETLILENYDQAKHISDELLYSFKYINSEILIENFSKYFNNIPIKFLDESYVFNRIIHKYTKYKQHKIITSQIDINLKLKVRELIDKDISQCNNYIIDYLEKIFSRQKQIEIEEKIIEDKKKYKIPVRRFPVDSRLLITEHPNCYYSELIIVKICKKIIKYQNRHNPVVRQIKIEKLEDILDNEDYKLVDRFDRQKRYCLDDDDNIYIE